MENSQRMLEPHRAGAGGPLVVCPTEGGGAELAEVARHVEALAPGAAFTLAGFDAGDWNAMLTPWPAENPFGGRFDGRAQETLAWLEEQIHPSEGEKVYIAGYSLGGLFALWACLQGDLFDGAASCSGSLWYPSMGGWLAGQTPRAGTRYYFSLGEREPRTRNPVLARVGEETARAQTWLCASLGPGQTLFEWNEGNHFKEPARRTARGIAWLLHGA